MPQPTAHRSFQQGICSHLSCAGGFNAKWKPPCWLCCFTEHKLSSHQFWMSFYYFRCQCWSSKDQKLLQCCQRRKKSLFSSSPSSIDFGTLLTWLQCPFSHTQNKRFTFWIWWKTAFGQMFLCWRQLFTFCYVCLCVRQLLLSNQNKACMSMMFLKFRFS